MEGIQTIERDELKRWMDEERDFTLIDVLPRESYETKHLQGAQHASAHDDDFVDQVNNLVPDQDATVVVYCASPSCQLSPHAADMLQKAGFTNVYDYEGGLSDWEEGGYSLEGNEA